MNQNMTQHLTHTCLMKHNNRASAFFLELLVSIVEGLWSNTEVLFQAMSSKCFWVGVKLQESNAMLVEILPRFYRVSGVRSSKLPTSLVHYMS